MPRVLLVTTNYWPEPTGISVYTTDLAESLKGSAFEVSVLTSLPHYPWWKVPSEFAHLTEGVTQHGSVQVIRVNHVIPRRMNALARIRFEISLWWNLRRVARSFVGKVFDAVIACIPTVAAGLVGKSIAGKLGIPFGLIVQDLSGAGAKQSGLRGGAIFSKAALAVEGAVLNAADSLVVVSPAMRDAVLGLGVDLATVSQITNYSARNIEVKRKDLARAEFGWPSDEFIVVHTGNMGAKQGLENVVEAAMVLGSDAKVKIYLVGHGNQEAHLRQLCKGLENIAVMDAVAEDRYSTLLAAADLLLVNERRTQMEMSLPSKLTSYLFSERPVIAAVPRGGATWRFLEGIAELVESGDPKKLAEKIVDLKNNPERRRELATLGAKFAHEHLDPAIGRERYLSWVRNLIQYKA